MDMSANKNTEARKTITFLPAVDVHAMLTRAFTNEKGEILYAQKSRVINDCLRDCLKRRGFARKSDLQAAA